MSSTEKQLHLAPADQPSSVHELTERLFPAYTVDNGAVHLAGCRLEDRLFLRMGDSGQARGGVLTMDESGRAIEEGFARSLGMDRTVAWYRPPELPPDCLEEMVRRSTQSAREKWGLVGELEAQFVWCKHAEGKLQFTIGDRSADLLFSGWTRTLEPPPFICPHSGVSTFHIAATDDGRIVAAESIRTCEETGCRVLVDDLVTCDATGMSVLADRTRICPVAKRPVLDRAFATCAMCRQSLSPSVIEDGRCRACRTLRPAKIDEAPLPAFLDEHQALRRWSKWAISETTEVFILVATGWWNRLVVVLDKRDLAVRHSAVGRRFGGELSAVDLDQLNSSKAS